MPNNTTHASDVFMIEDDKSGYRRNTTPVLINKTTRPVKPPTPPSVSGSDRVVYQMLGSIKLTVGSMSYVLQGMDPDYDAPALNTYALAQIGIGINPDIINSRINFISGSELHLSSFSDITVEDAQYEGLPTGLDRLGCSVGVYNINTSGSTTFSIDLAPMRFEPEGASVSLPEVSIASTNPSDLFTGRFNYGINPMYWKTDNSPLVQNPTQIISSFTGSGVQDGAKKATAQLSTMNTDPKSNAILWRPAIVGPVQDAVDGGVRSTFVLVIGIDGKEPNLYKYESTDQYQSPESGALIGYALESIANQFNDDWNDYLKAKHGISDNYYQAMSVSRMTGPPSSMSTSFLLSVPDIEVNSGSGYSHLGVIMATGAPCLPKNPDGSPIPGLVMFDYGLYRDFTKPSWITIYPEHQFIDEYDGNITVNLGKSADTLGNLPFNIFTAAAMAFDIPAAT